MTERERILGKIISTDIAFNEGMLGLDIGFDYDNGMGQHLGYLELDDINKATMRREGCAAGLDAIMRLLHAVGVESWNNLIGNEVWVERENHTICSIEAPGYREHEGKFDLDEWRARWFKKG